MSEDVRELLRKGIDAAKAGEKANARKLLQQVVEADPQNERGWLWLSSVVETDDEKYDCLKKVLDINPNNEAAMKAAAKIEVRRQETAPSGEELAPGISRQQFRLIVGGGIAFVVVVFLLVISLIIGKNNQAAAESHQATATAAVLTSVAQQTLAVQIQATQTAAVAFAGTQSALAIPTLPPTWTPTPTETPIGPASTSLPPPTGIHGLLATWSGRDLLTKGYLSLTVSNLDTGTTQTAGGKYVQYVDLSADGQRVVYTWYDTTVYNYSLGAINVNGTQEEVLEERWRTYQRINEPEMGRFSADGTKIVFVGKPDNVQVNQIFLLDLSNQSSNPVSRVTNDGADYAFPALSPDGTKIVAVRNDVNSARAGADLYVIDASSGSLTAITSDLDTFTESAPRWSPDGTQIIYAAAPKTDPGNSDIVLFNADGTGIPTLPVRSPADDVFPVFSPDGHFIAFSSNRGGGYDIYIYDRINDTLSQLTNTLEGDYPGGWAQPPSS